MFATSTTSATSATSATSTTRTKLENNGARSLDEEQRGGENRSPAPKARSRDWAALSRPVSVALFECSLQMETRDPFEPDPESGLRVDFSCGEYQYGVVDDHWPGDLSLCLSVERPLHDSQEERTLIVGTCEGLQSMEIPTMCVGSYTSESNDKNETYRVVRR